MPVLRLRVWDSHVLVFELRTRSNVWAPKRHLAQDTV